MYYAAKEELCLLSVISSQFNQLRRRSARSSDHIGGSRCVVTPSRGPKKTTPKGGLSQDQQRPAGWPLVYLELIVVRSCEFHRTRCCQAQRCFVVVGYAATRANVVTLDNVLNGLLIKHIEHV
jgi:hypothetical protein